MSEDEAPDDAQLIERMRARMGGGNLMEDLDAAAAAPGATSSPAREKLLKSPPKKSSVLPAGGGGGNDFDTDYAEMERQQAEAWAAASPKGGSAATEPPEIASEGEVASAASKRYAKSMKRAEPRSASGGRAVFGTAGRFPGPRDEQGGKSAENRTLGAEVSSIQEVTGVDAWLSKRGPPSSSPVPEEEQQEPEPEPQPDTSSRGLGSARKKERYQPKPMERHPVEKKVFAATFNTVPRGDIWSQEKHARHGSVHQRSHEDEFHATYKPDRPGPGWSNVRWSAETSQMLGRGEPGRAQQRDLYGQTDEDKEAQRRRMEQAQREYEAQQRVRNTPAWETNKKWKTKIRPVPAPEEPKPPREPPTVQLEPQMAFGKREAGQSSPFLSKKREDLFHHHTSGSPRPGQLHTSDANVSLPLRGDDVTDSEAHSPGNSSFKAAVHAVEAANYMLDHQIQKFADDSQVVQVAKEKWKGTLAGREGNKSAKELKKALGYAPKDTGSNQQPSGANASVNRSTCKTKRIEDEKKVRAVRWVVGDSDECFDRTSNHHPEHYKRLLHGTSAHAQRRVAEALRHDMNPSKGSVVSKIINRHGKGARKNKQLGGSQERWWTRGEGYYDVRKRCGYVPAGFEGQGGAAAGFEAGASGHAHANGAGSSSRPVSSPASASPGPQSRRHVYTGAEAGDGEDAQSDGSWDSEADGEVFVVREGVGAATRTTRARVHPQSSNPKQSPSCNEVPGQHEQDDIWAGREPRYTRRDRDVTGPQASPGDRTRNWVMSGAESDDVNQ